MAALEPHDLYELLGVPRDAPPDVLKRAYRECARALHPDVSMDPDAVDRFAAIAHAYEILSRPASRLLYDRFAYQGAVDVPATPEPPASEATTPVEPVATKAPAAAEHHDERAAARGDGAAVDGPIESTPSLDPPRIHGLEVTPLEARLGTRRRIPSDGWRRTRVSIPAFAYEGQLISVEDGRHVRVSVRERDTRFVRAAATVAAVAAAALLLVVGLGGTAL